MKKKICIVLADYYPDITDMLVEGSTREILDAESKNILKIGHDPIHVPGVFEIPVTIAKLISKYDAFVALGCVIKGETPHFDFISKTTIDAIMKLSVESKKPIGNGILTCMNVSQAYIRSDLKGDKRKGKKAAEAVLSVLGFKT